MSDKICVKSEDHPQEGDHFQGEAELRRHEHRIDESPWAPFVFRWRCSCGKTGRWVSRRWQAVQGAATHVRRAR